MGGCTEPTIAGEKERASERARDSACVCVCRQSSADAGECPQVEHECWIAEGVQQHDCVVEQLCECACVCVCKCTIGDGSLQHTSHLACMHE